MLVYDFNLSLQETDTIIKFSEFYTSFTIGALEGSIRSDSIHSFNGNEITEYIATTSSL